MLRLQQAAKAASDAAAAAAAAPTTASATAPSGGGGGGGVSLLGGDEGRKGAIVTKRRLKPGEIRIQKDIAELDAGKVGSVEFPNPNELTFM